MTNMDVIDSVNGFDERFFVEAADIDFTIRIRKSGRDLIRINQVLLVQGFGSAHGGQPDSIINFTERLRRKYGYVNLRLGLINNMSSQGYGYTAERISMQDEGNRAVNRTHKRFLNEFIRLYKKYISRWV
jgi:GT2 family glycosyltransferase